MRMSDAMLTSDTEQRTGKERLLAVGGLIGCALSLSCCILPLAFVTLGISGAWIGDLTALAPYQPFILAATLAFLAAGFWAVYWRRRVECEPGSYCSEPRSRRLVKGALWAATFMVIASTATNFVVPLIL